MIRNTHLEITEEEEEPRARANFKRIWRVVSPLLVPLSATLFNSFMCVWYWGLNAGLCLLGRCSTS
jgi:hypothetical protein